MNHVKITLLGLSSWFALGFIVFLSSTGVDGGWAGMAVMYAGIPVVLVAHLALCIFYIFYVGIAVYKNTLYQKELIAFPIVYYIALPICLLMFKSCNSIVRSVFH